MWSLETTKLLNSKSYKGIYDPDLLSGTSTKTIYTELTPAEFAAVRKLRLKEADVARRKTQKQKSQACRGRL